MREIYIVTHPEATHITENVVGGWYDSSLTAQGTRDAERIAQRLVELLPERPTVHLATSDLRRARQTAAPIARALGVEAIIDEDLRERSYGEAEGTTPGSTVFLAPSTDAQRMDHHPGTPGTETRREWATRVYRALDRVQQAETDHSVIVTHGGTLTYLLTAWIQVPIDHAGYAMFSTTPGGITRLREDDFSHDRHIVNLNDTSHLNRAPH
ncbi:histidine phosphatase family protein [Arthrobacter tumbae]|uniref:histidine phosphatase family protein n=1 Tax=Arthrobacter tumbae TaxID=163874 RepID=UPI0019576818|nr:histidine phosphatase family protein [Arthrobacter tumbae]MBM7781858.1 putative phosphoglycerate mutase [Arthrobacter tumbae]